MMQLLEDLHCAKIGFAGDKLELVETIKAKR